MHSFEWESELYFKSVWTAIQLTLLPFKVSTILYISQYIADMKKQYIQNLQKMEKIAICTDEANQQHYEVPPKFFELSLGENLKYSSCLFDQGAKSLEEAEGAMLDLYLQRAQVQDGMKILDLGFCFLSTLL